MTTGKDEESADLLGELADVFRQIGGDRFIYLPQQRVVSGGPEAAVDVFTEHTDSFYKFVARCKPKGASNETFCEQMIALLPQLPLTEIREEDLPVFMETDTEMETPPEPETAAHLFPATMDNKDMERGWLALSSAELERRSLLLIRRKNQKSSAELVQLLDDLKALPDIQQVNVVWNVKRDDNILLKFELVFSSGESARAYTGPDPVQFPSARLQPVTAERVITIARALSFGRAFKLMQRMKIYMSWCAGTHHLPAKVLLMNVPAYLANIPPGDLAAKVENLVRAAGWGENLLTVKVLHGASTPTRELILTFQDPDVARVFVEDAGHNWPAPTATEPEELATGPPMDKILLSDVEAFVTGSPEYMDPKLLSNKEEGELAAASPAEKLVILVSGGEEELAEVEPLLKNLADSWNGVRQFQDLRPSAAFFRYGTDPFERQLRLAPAAVVSFNSGEEAAAAAAATPTVVVGESLRALVLPYEHYMALPPHPSLVVGKKGMEANVAVRPAKKTTPIGKDALGKRVLVPGVVETEREIICSMPGKAKPSQAKGKAKPSAPAAKTKAKKGQPPATGKKGALSMVVVCELRGQVPFNLKWKPEKVEDVNRYFKESYNLVQNVRFHPKYPAYCFVRFHGVDSAESFVQLPQVKYRGFNVNRRMFENHKLAKNPALAQFVQLKEKQLSLALDKILAELEGMQYPSQLAPPPPPQADLRMKLMQNGKAVAARTAASYNMYSNMFAPYGYNPPPRPAAQNGGAQASPWSAPGQQAMMPTMGPQPQPPPRFSFPQPAAGANNFGRPTAGGVVSGNNYGSRGAAGFGFDSHRQGSGGGGSSIYDMGTPMDTSSSPLSSRNGSSNSYSREMREEPLYSTSFGGGYSRPTPGGGGGLSDRGSYGTGDSALGYRRSDQVAYGRGDSDIGYGRTARDNYGAAGNSDYYSTTGIRRSDLDVGGQDSYNGYGASGSYSTDLRGRTDDVQSRLDREYRRSPERELTKNLDLFYRQSDNVQRPVEARGPTVKKAERGLVFSGFTFELPGDVILDVLQGKLGVSSRDVTNMEWKFKKGKISFQVALALPTATIIDVMKQWNARPMQAGPGRDTIKANYYESGANDNKQQRGQQDMAQMIRAGAYDREYERGEPAAKKYRMQTRMYPY